MGTPRKANVPGESLKSFQAGLRGKLIQPGDPTYDADRALYNGMIDKRPAFIARCRDVADVISAVNFARENKLELAVRGGGHNGAGLGSVDHGLVIDLSLMRGVRVDPQAQTVRVEGGCVWGDVDHATYPFRLAVPSGFMSTTGVGGLTLGGGVGYLSRKYGLTIDNLLGVDLVLADGSFVTASANENSDLYWAVRGGGGNFGVVTSFLFRGCPVNSVYGGPMFWPLEHAAKVMRAWRDLVQSCPEDLNGWFGFHTVPPVDMFPAAFQLEKMAVITWCYTGDPAKAEEVFKPIRAIAPTAMDLAGPIPMPVLQSMFDGLLPPGMQWYWNADLFTDLTDEVVELHVEQAKGLPTPLCVMHLYPINGAVHRVGASETAWNYRQARFVQVIVGVDPDPAKKDLITQWSKKYWQILHPHAAGGSYVNMMMEEGQERIRATYRDNYPRLAAIKKKYDPDNLFHINQNIRPG